MTPNYQSIPKRSVLRLPAMRIQQWQTEVCSVLPLGQVILTGPRLCLPARQEPQRCHRWGSSGARVDKAHRLQKRNQGAGTAGDLQVTLPVLALLVRWSHPLCSPSQMAWRWRKWTVKGLSQVLALPPAAVDKSAPTFESRFLHLSFWNDKSVFSVSLTVLKKTKWDKLWKNSEY